MRFSRLAIVSVFALAACGGGDNKNADTATAGTMDTAGAAATTGAAQTGGTASMAPITGTTHEVKMIGDDKGYRFEPADISVKQGDGIKFTMVSGGPHNVAFDAAQIPADVRGQLDANLGADKMGELQSAMKMNPGETIMLSLGNVKPGTYEYNCTPHLAMGMKGKITVQ